jgi:hypothetical protein
VSPRADRAIAVVTGLSGGTRGSHGDAHPPEEINTMTGPELAREALRLTRDALTGKDSAKDMPQLSDVHRERNLQAALVYSNLATVAAQVDVRHYNNGQPYRPTRDEWDGVFA